MPKNRILGDTSRRKVGKIEIQKNGIFTKKKGRHVLLLNVDVTQNFTVEPWYLRSPTDSGAVVYHGLSTGSAFFLWESSIHRRRIGYYDTCILHHRVCTEENRRPERVRWNCSRQLQSALHWCTAKLLKGFVVHLLSYGHHQPPNINQSACGRRLIQFHLGMSVRMNLFKFYFLKGCNSMTIAYNISFLLTMMIQSVGAGRLSMQYNNE